MNTNAIIIAAVFVVIIAVFVGVALWLDMRKKEAPPIPVQRASAIERRVPRYDNDECFTADDVHRKYATMAETDPIKAGKLKYEELIRLHGKG